MANPFEEMKQSAFVVGLLIFCALAKAQNYQAIHGSPYAGSLGTYNNPASGIHSHYNWDITLLATQIKSSTNGFSATKPFMKLPEADVYLSNGNKKRFLHLSQDMHVLNTRFKLNDRKAVSFGFNQRNYVHINANPFNFQDTITSFNSFLQYNRPTPDLSGTVVNNTWAEIYLGYSQVIRTTNTDQISAGITLKAIRGISGVYLHLDRMRFNEVLQPGRLPRYVLSDPAGRYGYSSNYDRLDENKSSNNNVNDFLRYTQGSFGIDVGAEYLLKNDYTPQYDDEEGLDYNLKIGVSVLDIGRNLFRHGIYSRQFSGVLTDVSEDELEDKFESPESIKDFYDSLETVVQTLAVPSAEYYISQPTRVIVNVDKHIQDNFFVNAEVTVNLFSTQNKKRLHTRELNVLTVTPRWEKSMLGVYVPIQMNTQGQLWIGTAFKAGPLLLGVHDWRGLLSKNKIFNGGGYLALVIRNFFTSGSGRQRPVKNMDCPRI